jgi:hypothetical protein
MRATVALLLLLSPPLPAQQAPRFLYIYRDSLKSGVDSAYRAIEDRAAQICVDLECPNPYVALESLSGPHEAWWINAFAGEADTARVARGYATNRPLMEALTTATKDKGNLIGTPKQGYAVYRPDLSRGAAWSVAGARFMVVAVTRGRSPAEGSVWETADSTLYVFRPVKTRDQAEVLASGPGARVFAVRPNWSMPAREWVAADPDFWRLAPAPGHSR